MIFNKYSPSPRPSPARGEGVMLVLPHGGEEVLAEALFKK